MIMVALVDIGRERAPESPPVGRVIKGVPRYGLRRLRGLRGFLCCRFRRIRCSKDEVDPGSA
jgi:hypothetical protein